MQCFDKYVFNLPLCRPTSVSSVIFLCCRLYVFGGWVPVGDAEDILTTDGVKWVCTNSLSILNLGMTRPIVFL